MLTKPFRPVQFCYCTLKKQRETAFVNTCEKGFVLRLSLLLDWSRRVVAKEWAASEKNRMSVIDQLTDIAYRII